MATTLKTCRDCDSLLPITAFYKHRHMRDGFLNKCKVCVRARSVRHRNLNIDRIRAYDRKRGLLSHRKAAVKAYSQTEPGKLASIKSHLTQKTKFPQKFAARTALNNAVRDGTLDKPDMCEDCGGQARLHGHHDNYAKPLDVLWLCVPCHNAWHIKHGEALNGS